MPGRRPHRKSKTGCYNCKRRRVKCDERGPPCGTCDIHEEDCVYPATRLAPAPPQLYVCVCRPQLRSESSQSSISTPQPSTSAPPSNTLELELWHKWTVDTYSIFITGKPSGQPDKCQVLVPQLALRCDFLRYAILAISALDTVYGSPDALLSNASPYMLAALEYHNTASQAFRHEYPQWMKHGDGEDDTNITTIYAFSVINIALTFGLSECQIDLDQAADGEKGIVARIATLLSVLHSTISVIVFNLDIFSQGALPVIKDDPFGESRRQQLDDDTEAALERLRSIVLQSSHSQNDDAINQTNLQALGWLEKCFAYVCEANQDLPLLWPTLVSRSFIQVFEGGRDDVCRLIFLHWTVLLCWSGRGTKRFASSLSDKLAIGLSKIISGKDRYWEESIDWVLGQTGRA